MKHGPDTEELLRCVAVSTISLDVSHLEITSLPPLPNRLQYLDCHNTQLAELPPLPAGLLRVDCSNTPITKLPPLPANLEYMYCDNTPLTSLPPLPAGLLRVDCSNTQITKLPPLPAGLQSLNCEHTQLTELPPLPVGLQTLYCRHTQFTELPPLPANLRVLFCLNTPLFLPQNKNESIPEYALQWDVWREEKRQKAIAAATAAAFREGTATNEFFHRRVEQAILRSLRCELGRTPTAEEITAFHDRCPPLEFFEEAALNYDSHSCVAVKN